MSFQTYRVRFLTGVISTDDIIPARYKHMHTDPQKLAPHLFESFLPGFQQTIQPGDVIVSDSTFGIGSSREQAVTTLLANGIDLVLAPQFGRILFRNCWNLALPAIEIDTEGLHEGDRIEIDIESGRVQAESGWQRDFPAPPDFLIRMRAAGGLLQGLQSRLRDEVTSNV
ncbi:3-isopropylmalate dehydratase [Arthrobacter sp. NPDC090010]|uniref:LeuD/DmdB family oxidoreductase small subunit n=1 Tax=Arthrobacter sp. NPDC090010 TaxID=3363942 RepID=UPI0037FB24F4